MLVFEFKAYRKQKQFNTVDEAIITAQFIRNCCLLYWIHNKKSELIQLKSILCYTESRLFLGFRSQLNRPLAELR
jgi:putative transposase